MTELLTGVDRHSQWAADKYPGIRMGYVDVILAHTTETAGWPWYQGMAHCPQITIHPTARRTRQHFPVTMSSRALRDLPGGVETNRAHVFQFETIGYSDRALARSIGRDDLWVGNWGDAEYGYMASILAQVAATQPVPWRLTPRYTRNPLYGTNAWQRMSFAEWRTFKGWTGHAWVPENDHWDPGAMDLPRLMHLTRQRLAPDAEGIDMLLAHSQHDRNVWFLIGPTSARQVEPGTKRNLERLGVPVRGVVADETIRDLSDTGTAAGGIASPGVDQRRGPG